MGIEIDCTNARAEARKLIDISEQCGSIKATVLREKDLVSEYMHGNSGISTMELMKAWCDGLGSIENDLVQLSNLIVSTADFIEEQERVRTQNINKILQQGSVIRGTSASNTSLTNEKVKEATIVWNAATQTGNKTKNNNSAEGLLESALEGLSNLGKDIGKKLGVGGK